MSSDRQFSTLMNSPVLLLIFNRPGTTRRVFDAIRAARPARLYVAADGPRSDKQGDEESCAEARRIATAVDWDCEVTTLFREENLGCRRAVSGALDWFFAVEESGIVLEDDCLPSPSWFAFAQEMLERYRDDEKVMCVAAPHFMGDLHTTGYSYYFSAYAHCWGWASWRRAWKHYDHDMQKWPALRDTDFLDRIGIGDPLVKRYWTRSFDMAYEGIPADSWAYRWLFSCWAAGGLTALPTKNLVVNIGIGQDATHTQSVSPVIAAMRNEELTFPLKHPPQVIRDAAADTWEAANVFGVSRKNEIKRFLRNHASSGGRLAMLRSTLEKQLRRIRRGRSE